MKPVIIPTRIHYFYENILRHDLVLKLNCLNAMEIPKISTVIVCANNISPKNTKNINLALEILSGQKSCSNILSNSKNPTFYNSNKQTYNAVSQRASRLSTNKAANKNLTSKNFKSQNQLVYIVCSLRSRLMYNFLEKLSSFLIDYKVVFESLNHSKIQFHDSEIMLNLHSRELRLFPEIQNHFEIFENIQKAQVKIITSAKNKKSTKLLWTGLEQKDI